MSIRQFRESEWEQGVEEAIVYAVTTTPWGGGSVSPVVTVKQGGGAGAPLEDVTDDVTTGSASGVGDTVTTPVISGLTAGKTYRLEVKWTTSGGQLVEAYGFIKATE